ncbi:MAG: serine/threonine-protein kinase [Polyangiaceae bacterium]
MQELPPQSLIDEKFEIVRRLGEGGMGAVYEARNRGTGRRVAVKVIAGEALAKSKEVIARFQREALASGAIESQYIAHVFDTGVDPATGSPYMVMELLSGEDIEHAIKRLGPLPPELALRICAQACLGLQKAHEAHVVHRDIKPANIFLANRDGGEIVAKILDFGIAKVKMEELSGEARGLTRTGSMLGTPLYMSPEQALARKTIDHRTDVWSLGAVLYEALSGAPPHAHAETVGELIMCICSQPARLVQEVAPWVRPEVAAIVHTALAMDPAARFATAEDMFKAIAALLPNGYALHASMFVGLPDEARQVAAPQLARGADLFRPAPQSLAPPASPSAAMSSAPIQPGTTAGFGQAWKREEADPRKSRGGWVALGVGAVLLVGTTGVAIGVASSRSSTPAATTTAQGVAQATATATATTTPATSQSPTATAAAATQPAAPAQPAPSSSNVARPERGTAPPSKSARGAAARQAVSEGVNALRGVFRR